MIYDTFQLLLWDVTMRMKWYLAAGLFSWSVYMSLYNGKNLILHPHTRGRLDLLISSTQSTIISRRCALLSRSQQRHNLIKPSRLGLRRRITWGVCILAGDFMSYAKLLSWLLCFIASFFYHVTFPHPTNKRKTDTSFWKDSAADLRTIVTKWMRATDQFDAGPWRCNLLCYLKKQKQNKKALVCHSAHCAPSGVASLVSKHIMPEELRARLIYSWVIFGDNV